MKLLGISLAIALALSTGVASAQSHDDRYGPAPYGDYRHRGAIDERAEPWRGTTDRDAPQGHYEWARVLRVDPLFEDRSRPVYDRRECETRRDGYASRDPYDRGHGDGYGDRYRGDDRYDPYGQPRRDDGGRLVATVLGGIAGAVLGSRIGDGSGQVIGTAVGSMVGGAAGRGIYDANRRARDGYVTVCDPEPWRDGHRGHDAYGADPYGSAVMAYEVTYEYAGREYVTRTDHHPGDRIRVRVDVRAE